MAPDDSAWRGKPKPDQTVIGKIARKLLKLKPKDSVKVKLTNTSNYAKLYDITRNNETAAYMRVVPGELSQSVQNEASTVRWLQENTTLGLSSIFLSDDLKENALGYRWRLTQTSKGEPLSPEMWRQMPWTAKENLVRSLAHGHAQLLEQRNRFKGIGEIYFGVDSALGAEPSPGPDDTVEKVFYIGARTSDSISDNANASSPRGPYLKSSEWLQERLDGIIKELSMNVALVPAIDPEYDLEPDKLTISLAKRLRAKIPEVFFPEIDTANETVLWNTWLSEDNLLVSGEGAITEIFGFSHSRTVPLWRSYELPEVLLGSDQEFTPAIGVPDYHYHLMNLEKTKLRRLYLKTMESLHPGFKLRVEQYKRFVDFAYAVVECQMEPAMFVIKDWLDTWDRGLYYNIKDRLLGPWKACTNCGGGANCHDNHGDSESDGSLPALETEDEWEDEADGSPSAVSDNNDSDSETGEEEGYESAEENTQHAMAE